MRFHRPPSLPGIELWSTQVVVTGFSMIAPGYAFGAQDLGTQPRAVGWCRIGTRTCELTGEECLLIANPGECVRTVMTGPREILPYHQLFVEPACAARYLDAAPGELTATSLTRMEILESFARAWRAIESADLAGIEVEQRVRRFLVDVFGVASGGPARPPATGCDVAVRRVRALLEDRFAEPLTLAEIAKASYLSLFHLEHAFREKTGVAIHQYLKLVRLRRATDLLRAGQRPADVATACGFADQAHMSRIFRRTLGLTPGEIRLAFSRKIVQGSDATDC